MVTLMFSISLSRRCCQQVTHIAAWEELGGEGSASASRCAIGALAPSSRHLHFLTISISSFRSPTHLTISMSTGTCSWSPNSALHRPPMPRGSTWRSASSSRCDTLAACGHGWRRGSAHPVRPPGEYTDRFRITSYLLRLPFSYCFFLLSRRPSATSATPRVRQRSQPSARRHQRANIVQRHLAPTASLRSDSRRRHTYPDLPNGKSSQDVPRVSQHDQQIRRPTR